MAIDINIVEWLENWFTKKGSETRTLSQVVTDLTSSINGKVSVNQGNENASKNIVTNSGGTIVTQPIDNSPTQNSDNMVKSGGIYTSLNGKVDKVTGKGLSTEDYTSTEKSKLSGIESGANNYTHPTGIGTAQTNYVFKKIKYDSQGHITATTNVGSSDLPNHQHNTSQLMDDNTFVNITPSGDNQRDINQAIDTAIGTLSSIQAIQVVSSKPTASASTMGKLYIVSETENNVNKVNVYYTEQSGSTYSWHKMDEDILDELVINWSNVQGKPTKTSDFTNDGSDGSDTYVESGDLSTVATTGDYDDLSDKPNIPKVFYGTSSTSASTQTKAVTTSSDFSLESGVILFVQFSNAQDYNGTTGSELKLKVNNGSSINVVLDNSGNANAFATRYVWQSGEVVGFVYTGSRFLLLDRDRATTTYYGVTKLTDSTSSTSTTTSATPNSVKTAYDLANSRENPSNKVTSWSATTTDTNYPSEKLVKDSLDDLEDAIADFDASNIDFEPSSNMWGEYVQVVDTVAQGLDTLKEITNALNTSIIGKQDTGECITSIALIPYSTDSTGKIRLYFGDEP